MKAKRPRKLALSKETIDKLEDPAQLKEVAGGNTEGCTPATCSRCPACCTDGGQADQ